MTCILLKSCLWPCGTICWQFAKVLLFSAAPHRRKIFVFIMVYAAPFVSCSLLCCPAWVLQQQKTFTMHLSTSLCRCFCRQDFLSHWSILQWFVVVVVVCGFDVETGQKKKKVQRRNSRSEPPTPNQRSARTSSTATSPRSSRHKRLEPSLVAPENLDGLPKSPFFDKHK